MFFILSYWASTSLVHSPRFCEQKYCKSKLHILVFQILPMSDHHRHHHHHTTHTHKLSTRARMSVTRVRAHALLGFSRCVCVCVCVCTDTQNTHVMRACERARAHKRHVVVVVVSSSTTANRFSLVFHSYACVRVCARTRVCVCVCVYVTCGSRAHA